MAPIKFEEHIKEQLEQRNLSPSKDAWSKLDQRLDEHEDKGKNKSFWWIGIAASFIGVLLVVSFLFKDEKAAVETNVMVGTEQSDTIDKTPIKKEKTILSKEKEKEEQIADVNLDGVTKEVINKQPVEVKQLSKQKTFKKHEDLLLNTPKDVMAEVKIDKQKTPEKLKIETSQYQDIEAVKAQEVVAQILELKQTKNEVSDKEIDALLDAAHKEITLQRIYNEDTNTVDADALLRDVEFDIEEESFRSKVFEMLKAGYKEVKTAVAERNN